MVDRNIGESKLRVAIINPDKCKPKKCQLECKGACPINKQGKLCIEVGKNSKCCVIQEALCVGCNACVMKCPFSAIKIINLPKDLSTMLTHRYNQNSFKLHHLPTPRPGQVLGLVGTNGIGKSTALQILSGDIKPNLGKCNDPPSWQQILKYYRGSEIQNYFIKLLEDKMKTQIKLQFIENLYKILGGKTVAQCIQKMDEKKVGDELAKELQLDHLYDRNIEKLSGGELQRFAILLVCISKVDVYMFDEPSSFLDIKQRLTAAKIIRKQAEGDDGETKYVITVEHDLAVLDYLSDFVCVLYGEQSAYGIVTMPYSVREGINVFLAGFIPSENMRFRDYELSFKITQQDNFDKKDKFDNYKYPNLKKKQGGFELEVCAGSFKNSEIVVMLGENGTGKTTFVKILAGKDKELQEQIPELHVSVKPQSIKPTKDVTVETLLSTIKNINNAQFQTDVYKPMHLDDILGNEIKTLSGGEIQRVSLVLALGKPAEVYLIDEPSAYLDSEQRITSARAIKRFILNSRKAAFVVEHDFIMATYLADKVIVFEGEPGIKTKANEPEGLIGGMNRFLSQLSVTFRRDPSNFRPRINKLHSNLDREQKQSGKYFCQED